MIDRAKISAMCDAIIEEKRWRPFKDKEVTITKGGVPLSACLTLDDRRIHLSCTHDLDDRLAALAKKHDLAPSTDAMIEDIIYHLFVHEYNHHHYCPNNEFLFAQILDGMRKVAEKREIREAKIRNICFDLHNMFSDTVINTIESHDDTTGRYRRGQDLAHLVALSHWASSKVFGKRMDEAMRLFLESNMRLCRTDQHLYQGFQHYLPRFSHAQARSLGDIVEIFLEDDALATRVMDGTLLGDDPELIVRQMCDYRTWHTKAEDYARIMMPYWNEEHQMLKNHFTGKRPDDTGAQQETQQGAERDSDAHQDQDTERKPGGSPSNGAAQTAPRDATADDENATPQNDATIIFEPYAGTTPPEGIDPDEGAPIIIVDDVKDTQKNRNAKKATVRVRMTSRGRSMGRGSGLFTPERLDYDFLNGLYEERAGVLKIDADERGMSALEILRGTEETKMPSMDNIHLPSTLIVDRPGGTPYLALKERRFPLEIDARIRDNMGGLPDLCFVFDSSGSMVYDPLRGRGEYHIALLTFYSIVNGLERHGIAPLLQYNAINFSNMTFASGWQPYLDLEHVKRTLLQYQGGGTTIDVEKLSAVRTERKDNYILFLLSDLAITNIDDLVQELITTHESRTAAVMIFKLGGQNLLSKNLEQAGINVLYPDAAEDFMNTSIRITRDVYTGAR